MTKQEIERIMDKWMHDQGNNSHEIKAQDCKLGGKI